MNQYAHSVTVNNNGTVSINLASHDDVTVAVFLNHKTCGSWTAVDFASLDAAEKMAQDLLAAVKERRDREVRAIEAGARFKQKAEAEIKAHVAQFAAKPDDRCKSCHCKDCRCDDLAADLIAEEMASREPAHVADTDAF